MIRKLLVRLFLASVASVAMVGIGIGICVWLAIQPTPEYSRLLKHQFTAEDQQQADQRFQQLGQSIDRWSSQSEWLAKQAKPPTNPQQSSLLSLAKALTQPAINSQRRIEISQDDLNAVLSSTRFSGDQLKDVRVRIANDRILLAGRLESGEFPTMFLSLDLRLRVQPDGKLQIALLNSRVGRLTLPLASLLRLVRDEIRTDDQLEIDLDSTPITLTINPGKAPTGTPRLKQISSDDGKLIIDLTAPAEAL